VGSGRKEIYDAPSNRFTVVGDENSQRHR
jgi:hypothetical protein